MKKSTKLLSAVLSSAMTLTAIPCYNVLASDKDITVELNGNQITFDVNPQIIDGSTMVPLRKIFEELGAYVNTYMFCGGSNFAFRNGALCGRYGACTDSVRILRT